ncbi:MAG: bcr [Pseudonocardiales bacterium]|nr:bcr [Pseudonocardiales bacterium]
MSAADRTVSRPGVLLAFLGLVNAFGAFSTDTYLPALPRMVSDLHASDAAGQLTLTSFIVGLAVGQLVAGAISDAIGRRRPMIAGAAIYVAASLGCAVAPSIQALVGLRLVQGLAAAAGMVCARAAVRDTTTGAAAATMYSRLLLIAGVAPIVAPMIGAGIERIGGWRGVFVAMACLGLVIAVGTTMVPETINPATRRSRGGAALFADWRSLAVDKHYVALTLTLSLAFAAMFGYISAASFVLKLRFDLTPTQFAAAFGVSAVGFIGGNLVGTRFAARRGAEPVVAAACLAMVAATAGLVVAIALNGPLPAVVGPVLVVFISAGMLIPNTMTLALMPHPSRAGSAAALMGVAQFVVAGAFTPIIGAIGAGGLAFPVFELTAATLAAVSFFVIRPATRRDAEVVLA